MTTPYQTIRDIQTALHSGETTASALVEAYLTRIEKFDGAINSLITQTADSARQQAATADKARKAGVNSPLLGVPIIHKDIFCTKNVLTTCGSRMLSNFVPPYDAHVVTQLNSAGCIMLGKANMDEFAMGSSNETSFFGAVSNPWAMSHVPGGSSGGSAAAVAAGLAPAATGTDTGGSIRQPAALCGITGLKPTYGRVSRYGMIAYASSLDQGGPMAQTAEDCAILLNEMAGHDPRDATCRRQAVPDYTHTLNDSIAGRRIGLPAEYLEENCQPEVHAAIMRCAEQLKELGATLHEVSLPHTHLAPPVYYVLAPAECSSNLARYDGIRFGHRSTDAQTLEGLYERSRSEGFGDEVKRRILTGTYVLSSGYYDAYYKKAQHVQQLIQKDFTQVWETVDCLLTPTAPGPAFQLGEKTKDPVAMYLSDIYTIAVNLAGLPALSLPAGIVDGLPIGAQLIGKAFDEATILNVAHQFQCHTHWHQQHPTLDQLEG